MKKQIKFVSCNWIKPTLKYSRIGKSVEVFMSVMNRISLVYKYHPFYMSYENGANFVKPVTVCNTFFRDDSIGTCRFFVFQLISSLGLLLSSYFFPLWFSLKCPAKYNCYWLYPLFVLLIFLRFNCPHPVLIFTLFICFLLFTLFSCEYVSFCRYLFLVLVIFLYSSSYRYLVFLVCVCPIAFSAATFFEYYSLLFYT